MDFAKNLLKKYGWKEGDGLGKNNNGINKPLRAILKFDTAGLGVDKAATEFNNHWWERIFNEAAQNVQIENDKNGIVNMNLKNPEDTVEITTQSYSVKKLKKAKALNGEDARYNNFIQCATLSKSGDHIENAHKIELSDIAVASTQILTDEQLFEACGGRTAHKGARHGLTLSGKLSRIERQEEELLAKMTANYNGLNKKNIVTKNKKKEEHKNNNISAAIATKKKKKKHKDNEKVEETTKKELMEVIKRSKKVHVENEKIANNNRPSDVECSEEEPKLKKKKKKSDRSKDVESLDEVQYQKKSKKKKCSVEVADDTQLLETVIEEVKFKKKSKKKKLNKV